MQSPSRLLCLMDPILPMGILTRCLAAYAGIPEPTSVGQVQGADDKVTQENEQRNDSTTSNGPSSDENSLERKPARLRASSSSTIDIPKINGFADSAAAAADVVDGPLVTGDGEAVWARKMQRSASLAPPKNNHWFGRTVTSFFKNLQAKPVEVGNLLRKLQAFDALSPEKIPSSNH